MDVKQEAIKLFNETWDLLDKPDRTPDEERAMLHKTHASYYLWSLVGTHLNLARGEWQVSRVYATLGMGAAALLHGECSLALCLEHGYGDFDLAFGYEAVARAHMVLEDGQAAAFKAKCLEACEAIAKKDDKDYVLQ